MQTMRYQIFRLQQEALVNLEINTEEALLLDWLLNWKDGGSMERIVVGDDLAYWVNYSTVVEQLPILFSYQYLCLLQLGKIRFYIHHSFHQMIVSYL